MENLVDRLNKFVAERDWDQFHNPKDLAVSVSIEAAELLEVFQWTSSDYPFDDTMKERIEDEVADVFLYLALLCEKTGINLLEVAMAKIEKNEKRFPALESNNANKSRIFPKKC